MGTDSSTGRVSELDGVRGIAILLVLGGHAVAGPVAAAGVTLFFVLSGYLITGILLRQHERGGIRLGTFYWRRFTRLAPPLFFVVAVVAILNRGLPADSVISPLTWTTNYAGLLGYPVELLEHTWSLAVEEQFYLVWPLLLIALLRTKRLAAELAGILVVLLAWRLVLTASGHLHYSYLAFETAGSSILAGCLIAVAGWRVRSRMAVVASCVALAVLPVVIHVGMGGDWWRSVPFFVTPFAAVVVAGASSLGPLRWRWLGFCGVASYSMYLWHLPISFLYLGEDDYTILSTALGAACGIAAYFVLERPVMLWRQRQGSGRDRAEALPSARGAASSADPSRDATG